MFGIQTVTIGGEKRDELRRHGGFEESGLKKRGGKRHQLGGSRNLPYAAFVFVHTQFSHHGAFWGLNLPEGGTEEHSQEDRTFRQQTATLDSRHHMSNEGT